MNERITALEDALRPFADFADARGFDRLPDHLPMTQGSRFALRQVTVADFKAARAALAASRAAPDCQQPNLVTAEMHRSFPDAGDGRPMPPMGDDLMTAGLSADDARFVAVQLAQNGLTLVASQPAQPVAVKVKPLVWIKSGAASQFGNYIVTCEDHDDRTVWFVMFGGKVLPKCGEHDSEASAKAAAQADYEARILAALDLTPAPAVEPRTVTAQEAALVLLAADLEEQIEGAMSDAVDETDDGTWIDEDRGVCVGSAALMNAWTAALRAIGGDA